VDDVGYFNAVFGIKAKYYLRQTFIRPYLVGVLGVQNGILFLSDYTKYNKGLVIGGGAGLSTVLFDRVKLALEGRFNLGFGLWDDAPVFNSSGVSFNANYAYALFTIGYRVGS
jgi:hypothetical protein